MRRFLAILALGLMPSGGCASHDLSGPPVSLVEAVPGKPGIIERSRGEAELYLTRDNPSHTFWNDRDTRQDAWGTVTLTEVAEDGTVTIDLSGTPRRARPGRAFPGTGIHVIASNPTLHTALLRTRWTRTVIGGKS